MQNKDEHRRQPRDLESAQRADAARERVAARRRAAGRSQDAGSERMASREREANRPQETVFDDGTGAPHGGIKGIPYIPTPRTEDESIARWHSWGVAAFAVLMVFFTVVGLLLFARPQVSELEKRELTTYPAYTVQTFLDGTGFTQAALWYSDTYPLRETLVQADFALNELFGINLGASLVGGNVQADELPVTDDASDSGDSGSSSASTYDPNEPVAVPDEKEMDEAIQGAITDGLYVEGDAAYNIYYFAQEAVDRYAMALNTCAENLDGVAKVYSIIIPNTSGAKLDETTLAELGGTDQEQAIKYFYSKYSDKVTGVWIWDTLREHRDEYTYFRTDHHWTQLGAYYAYVEFCKAKGIDPIDIPATRTKQEFGPFLGSFYSDLGEPSAMSANPDTVEAWVPRGTNDLTIWDENGQENEGQVITDVTGWAESSLYNAFIGGDEPLERIENPSVTDGSSCLVVKDSFGCCFVPCLVDNYQTVWVIDFRYSSRSIPNFVRENGIQDVIFINNMSMAGTDPVSQAILSQVQNEDPVGGGETAGDEAAGDDTGEEAGEEAGGEAAAEGDGEA